MEKEKALALQREVERAAREKEMRELEEKRKALEEKRKLVRNGIVNQNLIFEHSQYLLCLVHFSIAWVLSQQSNEMQHHNSLVSGFSISAHFCICGREHYFKYFQFSRTKKIQCA